MALSIDARELELYATNTEAYFKPVIQNLSKHYKRGNFSPGSCHPLNRALLPDPSG